MKHAAILATALAASTATAGVLEMNIDEDGWRVARLDGEGVVLVVDGDWSGSGIDAFTVMLGAPDPMIPGSQIEWLRACRTEAALACRDAKQDLCWVYARHNGGSPDSSATCLFACRTQDGCPPYPATPAAQ